MLAHSNTVTLDNDSPHTVEDLSYPMRVFLISNKGIMYTTWLPAEREGFYKFLDASGDDRLPFYVIYEEDWTVHVGKDAVCFCLSPYGEEIPIGRSITLKSQTFTNIRYGSEIFFLYAETEYPGDCTYLPYYLEEGSDYVIGRSEDCHICYPNCTVSRHHAKLHWGLSGWSVIDTNSTNGVYVNGKRVRHSDLHIGDQIFIMGLCMFIGHGYIAMNNHNDRVTFHTHRIRHIERQGDITYAPSETLAGKAPLFDRKPRRVVPITADPIEFQSPPPPLGKNAIPMLLRLGSPMMMGGKALATGNIFTAIISLVLPSLTQGLTEKDRKEYEEKRVARYREYLKEKRDEIEAEKRREEELLIYNYPELNRVMGFSVSGERLWERRRTDEDFLKLRLGYGDIPMIAEKKYNERRFEMDVDALTDEMYTLAEKPVSLRNVPILVSLSQDYIIGVTGSRERIIELTRDLILQTVFTHSYDEVKIVLAAEPVEARQLAFVRYLPHLWDNERNIRFLATEQSDVQEITKYLNQEFEGRLKDTKKRDLKKGVSYIIIVLSKKLFDYMETMKDVLNEKDYHGFSLIAAFEGLPKECRRIVELASSKKLVNYTEAETEDRKFELDPFDERIAVSGLRKIMNTRLMMDSAEFLLPPMVTFLEMYRAGRVEHLNPLKRWAENNPVQSLAVPIGVSTDGSRFTLDLHEKRQGPHGLIAGMTGSGKSEFIISYILSMAVNFSPDEIAFVLIDYKGGGLADAFEDKARGIHLPHLVGTITNLDGASIQRSLLSIESELKRRQTVFKQAKSETAEGTMDIYDYQKLYRAKRVKEPMPHLFIISDEFAELKSQQPEFMNQLISAARIGRSLGVHLILATQKPGGVVNDQILSNTKFRVCLRVQDRNDSMEMLKRPDAAEIQQTGRFYLQVGYNEFFAMGQSAWCGAEYTPQEEVIVEEDLSVQFLDNVGRTILRAKPPENRTRTGSKQIVSIVRYLSDLAKREKIEPRSLWLDPLPAQLEYDTLSASSRRPSEEGVWALLGLVDDPERQRQIPFHLNLLTFHNMFLCGNSGCGKSTLISIMLLDLVTHYSPMILNYYILDLSAGALNAFRSMPHCGAYLTEKEDSDVNRMFDLLREIIAERKRVFAEAGVTNYAAYIQVANMPLIVVVIDGFTNIRNLSHGLDYYNSIHEYLRDAANYGLRYILSCNHTNEASAKCKQEMDYRLALHAKDRYEYGDILETRCTITPPETAGRGVCTLEGRPLEYQVPITDPNENSQTRGLNLQKRLQQIAETYKDIPGARRLAMIEDDQEYSDFCTGFETGRFPMGYSTRDLRRVALPFQQMYSISLYFGNPVGVRPVLMNLITAAKHNNMDMVLVRREADTLLDSVAEASIRNGYAGSCTILDCTQKGISSLNDLLFEQIRARNVFRDEYCLTHGIPETDKGRARKAARYIRSHTRPLFVLFESFTDLCKLKLEEEAVGELTVFLSRTKGYNLYFAGCFYAEDEGNISVNPIMKCYNRDELLMLFGGRYDKQSLTNLPMDFRRIEQINPKYDRYLLKYRGNYFTVKMPCGSLNAGDVDPDEAAIIE